MRVRIARWGNSLAVRIPASFAKAVGAAENGTAELSISGSKLMLEPVPEVEYELAALIDGITDDNRHEEVSTGSAVGEEFS